MTVLWVRVTGCTVYVFPPTMTGSQLDDEQYQAGTFRGTGLGTTTATANTGADPEHLGEYETRAEAIHAVLRHHDIVPTENSVGIR